MTRGKIDLGTHKLAGLYRAPAGRERWKRARREKCPDEVYRQLWKLVGGAVRDTFACHPEYLTPAGRTAAERSIVKRVTGSLHGYATQVARGRSAGLVDAPADAAAIGPDVRSTGRGWMGWLEQARPIGMLAKACRGMVLRAIPKIHGGAQ